MQVPSTTGCRRPISWLVIGAVLVWKLALLVLTTQPVPANDAFFYDGAVVNYLLNGKYANPTLALTLPVSGTEVFSAYPPLYQAVLFVWMSLFGTSAVAAMVLHFALFGCYAAVLFAILRRLDVPPWCVNLGGAFLFVITFHDRPDSLAHVLGMVAVWGLVRSGAVFEQTENPNLARWLWFTAASAVLCVYTSLQIGAVYICLLWLGMFAGSVLRRTQLPFGPMLAMVVVPFITVAVIALGFPKLWAGFVEHAHVTPSMMGLHLPSFNDVLKIARTVPGVILAALLFAWLLLMHRLPKFRELGSSGLVGLALVLPGLVIIAVCMFFWSPNMVLMAAYLQPLAVACVLARSTTAFPKDTLWRRVLPIFVGAALIGAVRAIGMSTWGAACAADVNYTKALDIVRGELAEVQRPSPVVLSSAYLYEAAKYRELNCIHSDWVGKFVRGKQDQELDWLIELKPPKLILTQFDYYRRYERVLAMLKNSGADVEIQLTNSAQIRPPDAYPLWQRVVQHICWAPVVVELNWR